jgi:hypothetical protein
MANESGITFSIKKRSCASPASDSVVLPLGREQARLLKVVQGQLAMAGPGHIIKGEFR